MRLQAGALVLTSAPVCDVNAACDADTCACNTGYLGGSIGFEVFCATPIFESRSDGFNS